MHTLVVLILAAPPAFVRQDEETRRRQQEAEKLQELERREFFGEPSENFYFDYGAWLRPGWFVFRDGSGRDISRLDVDARAWVDLRYREHQFYARARLVYSKYSDGGGPRGRDEIWDGPAGDVVYYQLLFGDLVAAPDRIWDLVLRAGRQYERIGSGLVYNGVGDGLQLRGNVGPVDFEFFGHRAIVNNPDIDQSRPTADQTHRYFAGGIVSVRAIQDHTPFVAALVERDTADDADPDQEYTFNAQYYGAGLHGQLFLEGLSYELEGWLQRGTRFSHLETGTPEDVDAYALLASIDYAPAIPTKPRFHAGFMLGSGDQNRFRVTNSRFGHLAGTDDETFLAFGWIQTGYSLAPLLSNLRIYHAGASFRPLEGVELAQIGFDRLELGVDYYYYRKDRAGGGISDVFAGFDNGNIGYEIDASLQWAILSDFSIQARMGFFFPGSAYLDDGVRPFFSFSAVYSF